MMLCDAMFGQSVLMGLGAVSCVAVPSITGMLLRQRHHALIPPCFGKDRRGRD